MRLLLPLLLFSLFGDIYSYKILMYSIKYGYSHMNYIGSIADTLQAAGHSVTVIMPQVDLGLKTTGCQLAKVIEIPSDNETKRVLQERRDHDKNFNIWSVENDPSVISAKGPSVARIYSAAMQNVLNQKSLMEQLKKENFDLGIFELLDYAGYPVLYEAGITKIVGCLSAVLGDRVASNLGLPGAYSFVPALQGRSSDDGSLSSRFWNLIYVYFSSEYERIVESAGQRYMDEHHPNAPKIREVVSNMPAVFTNAEPLIDFPRPTLHKIVDLGGIGLKPAKQLNEEWIELLSKRKTNVLISFGSMAPSSAMHKEYKESFIALAKTFPEVTFIWKYEKPEDGIGKGIDNLHLSTWTPQSDLLASGRISLFISHGGLGSVMESTTAGVPMVTIPLFGDQYRNALMVERFGNAIFYPKEDLSKTDKLIETVRKALVNQKIKEKAELAKEILKNRPFSPQQKLLRHIELAVKFGNNLTTLSPSGRHFSLIQYYNLDIFAILASIFVVVVYVVVKVIVFLLNCTVGKKKME